MQVINEFITMYGSTILYTIFIAIAGYIGIVLKNLYEKYINDKTKQDVVKTCVQAVKQIYKDLHGDEKLQKAVESASEMLANKGIVITDIELRMLIEAAVAEFNDAFNRTELTVETETEVGVSDGELEE